MRLIDEQYTKTPFFGVPRMTHTVRQMGYPIGPKRIRRLMRTMGIEAIYPKRNLSKAVAGHHKFPYLLKGLDINRPEAVWATDITYIRIYG
jgi:putative transposase